MGLHNNMVVPIGTSLEMAEADIVVLYTPRDGLAWVIKNRIGKSCEPARTEHLDEGAVVLLVHLEMGNVKVRPVHRMDG